MTVTLDHWDLAALVGALVAVTGLACVHPGLAVAAAGACVVLYALFVGSRRKAKKMRPAPAPAREEADPDLE